jgi:predicted PurR-regulated permease PerM
VADESASRREATEPERADRVRDATEIAVRLGVLLVLVVLCLWIMAPFIGILMWAAVIAIGLGATFERIAARLAGRRGLAAGLLVAVGLLALIVPTVLLSETLVSGVQAFAGDMEDGRLNIPPPPDHVADWPFVGEQIHELWLLSSVSLEGALARLEPQLRAASLWLLAAAPSVGMAVLQLVASIVIAGILLAGGSQQQESLQRIGARLWGDRGADLVVLANTTVQSVVQGIVGVAVIQALLAALGFLVAGIPAAGLWAMIVLVSAIVQLPVLLVMIPPVLIMFSNASTVAAGIFAAWCLGVALLDNVLKPILFGRGAQVPTVVIFVGAIGGMLAMGILGLFVGAVILSLGYEIFRVWISDAELEEA